MRWPRLLLAFAVAAGLTSASACSSGGSSVSRGRLPAYEVELPPAPPPQPEAVDKIRTAATPSDAVAQYSSAIASGAEPLPLERAYVKRMVAFGLPEMAEAQAGDLTRRDPNDGVAQAVLAFMSARREQNDAALKQIAVAARNSPDDTFVQRTGGQMLAWYDSQPDHMSVSSEAQQAAFEVRARSHEKDAFADAYKEAWDRQHPDDQAFAPATQPATNRYAETRAEAPVSEPSTQDYSQGYSGGYYDSGLPPVNYNYAPYYTDPYAYHGYSTYCEPYWPSSYYFYGGYRSPFYYPYYGYRYPVFRAPLSHRAFDHGFDHGHADHHDDHHDDGNRVHDFRKSGDDPRARTRTQDRATQTPNRATQTPNRATPTTPNRVTPTNPRADRPSQAQQSTRQQPQQRQQQQRQSSTVRRSAQSSRSSDSDGGGRSASSGGSSRSGGGSARSGGGGGGASRSGGGGTVGRR